MVRNLLDLSIVQGYPRKHIFISKSTQTQWNLHCRHILGFHKNNLFFKLIFRTSELPQRPKFDIFLEVLFCTSASSTNLVPKVASNEAVFLLKPDRFLSFCAFSKK